MRFLNFYYNIIIGMPLRSYYNKFNYSVYYLLNNFPVTSAIFKSKLGGRACCKLIS